MIIKALSVKQPWAMWIAWLLKPIETRTWKTEYRGKLLIVASKQWDSNLDVSLYDLELYPFGMAVCIADLVDCRSMIPSDERLARCPVYPRANSLVLANVHKVNPFPVKGRLHLFDVELPEGIL